LTRLLTEDRAEQSLLCREFRFTPRRDLTDENIVRTYLGADADNSALIQIRQAIFADVRDVSGNLFRAKLRITRFGFILLNMDRRKDIVLDQTFANQDGVLEVTTLPGHKRHVDVLSQRQLAVLGARTVGNDIAS